MDIKKTYYYNNRPVKIVHKTSENMYLVCANTGGITTTLSANQFCMACQVGDSDNKLACNCEENDFMIEDFLDEVSQENDVFWVHKKLLKKQYFEQKSNDKLVDHIKNLKLQKDQIIAESEILRIKNDTVNNHVNTCTDDLIALDIQRGDAIAQLEKLQSEALEISSNIRDIKILSDIGISIKITTERYRELLINESKMQSLYHNGVDNWDYYSDAIGDKNYEMEADDVVAAEFRAELSRIK